MTTAIPIPMNTSMITNIRTDTAIRNTATPTTINTLMPTPSHTVMTIVTTAGGTATTTIMMPIRQLRIIMNIRDTKRKRMTMAIDRQAGPIPAGRGGLCSLPAHCMDRLNVIELLYHMVEQYAGLVLAPDEEIILSMGGTVA